MDKMPIDNETPEPVEEEEQEAVAVEAQETLEKIESVAEEVIEAAGEIKTRVQKLITRGRAVGIRRIISGVDGFLNELSGDSKKPPPKE